jgi:hypothetical protein
MQGQGYFHAAACRESRHYHFSRRMHSTYTHPLQFIPQHHVVTYFCMTKNKERNWQFKNLTIQGFDNSRI